MERETPAEGEQLVIAMKLNPIGTFKTSKHSAPHIQIVLQDTVFFRFCAMFGRIGMVKHETDTT